MLERACENAMFYSGGAIGYYSGDIKELTNDLKALKPTVMPAVPRLLNRVYDKIHNEINHSPIKKMLFRMALNAKESEMRRGIIRRNSLWDKIVFRKVQEAFGGRLRLMVAGSAPLAGSVLTFIRCSLGCLVVEGYGQTECVAAISLTVQGDFVPEHVGPPIACNCIKVIVYVTLILNNIVEKFVIFSWLMFLKWNIMQIISKEKFVLKEQMFFKGNIMNTSSHQTMLNYIFYLTSYFRDPERTAATIDEHGWHHTGDIGQWLPNGTMKIIDRKKHIFKLSQGEYIVPEKIENIYMKSQYIEQVFVHGESLKVKNIK